jgi:hypothetical protein
VTYSLRYFWPGILACAHEQQRSIDHESQEVTCDDGVRIEPTTS